MAREGAMFVPAVLGLGLLVSVGAVVRDAIHRVRGRRWLDRRAAVAGHRSALLAVEGERSARRDLDGRRPRAIYTVTGLAAVGLAGYLLVGSYGNYIGWTGWVVSIGWIWFAYLVAVAGFALVGMSLLAVAVNWERPPAWTVPLLARSPFGRLAHDASSGADPPSPVLSLRAPEQTTSFGERAWRAVHVDERTAELARLVAGIWSMAAVVVLSVLALQGRIPRASDPSTIESGISDPVQFGILVIFGAGSLLTAKHEATGAAVMAAATAAIALISAIQYPAWAAILLTIALGVPAFLHWLAWQRDRHLHHVVALAVISSIAIIGVGVAADALADRTIGPTHPETTAPALPPSPVTWIWAGATTDTSTTVVAQLSEPGSVRLAVDEDPSFASPWFSPPSVAIDTEQRIVRFTVDGLGPDTEYHYAVERDGRFDLVRAGTVRTFPSGAASFRIALGSCARSRSNGAVFDAIRELDPLVYLQLGDFHYANIVDDDPEPFVDAYTASLETTSQSALYRSTSVAYVWDDHDYGGNDADRTSPSRDAANIAYRRVVPHYPLVLGDRVIAQTFTAGRVRFVLTDARSERDPAPDVGDPTMLGAEQLDWLERELRLAAAEPGIVVWMNASPWIAAPEPGGDSWGSYPQERARIATVIEEAGLSGRLLIVSGDAHMVAFDDGSNSGYGASGGGVPVFHAAALDRPGGVKGGPYTSGTFPGGGQFGTIDVHDDGGPTIDLALTGRTWDGRELMRATVTLDAQPASR